MNKGNIDDSTTVYRITDELCYLTEEPDNLYGVHCRVIGHGSPELAQLTIVLTDSTGVELSREQLREHIVSRCKAIECDATQSEYVRKTNRICRENVDSLIDILFDPICNNGQTYDSGAYVEYNWENISAT